MGYIAGAGHDKQDPFGALLELLLIIANIGTAVVIFPIVRRQNEELALGYVTARIVRMHVHPRRHRRDARDRHVAATGAGAAEGTVAYTLAAIKDWTFLLGPGWVVGWGNGLILGYLMYRSGLVPRRLAWLGLVGGPLIIVSGTAVIVHAATTRAARSARCKASRPSRGPVGALPRRLLHLQGLQAVVTDPPGRGSRGRAPAMPAAAPA